MTATDMRDKKGYPHRATGAEGQILAQPVYDLELCPWGDRQKVGQFSVN